MSNWIGIIVYIAVLIIFYVVVFVQKGEARRMRTSLRSQDWIFFFSMIAGGVVFAQTLLDTGIQLPANIMIYVLSGFLVLLLIYALVKKRKTGRPMVQMMGDERLNLIYAKSSRNALFATYLVLFVNSCLKDVTGLDANWTLIMLGSGILVLLASTFVYYFRES